MKPVIAISFLLCGLAGSVFSQRDCPSSSAVSDEVSKGANEQIEFEKVRKVSSVFGKIMDLNGTALPISIIDVYEVTELSKSLPTYRSIGDRKPIKSYGVDRNGNYCLDLADGIYVLRFGTKVFGFNHSFVKVHKTKSGSVKAIDIRLTLGT